MKDENRTITRKTPAEMMQWASGELTAARTGLKEVKNRYARDKAAGIQTSRGLSLDHAYSVDRESAQSVLSSAERTYIRVCLEYGDSEPVTLSTETKALIDSWSTDNEYREMLVDIARRQEGDDPKPHAAALIAALGTRHTAGIASLGIRCAARLLNQWIDWREASETYRQVKALSESTLPAAVRNYIDQYTAEEDRDRSWSDYGATPGSPDSLERYAWPGGDPMYYQIETPDSVLTMCPKCASQDQPIGRVQAEINYEDPDLWCEGCNKRIESAYAEPDPPAVTLKETRLSIWQERDRLSIGLIDTRNGAEREIVTFWDVAAGEAITDGLLSHKAILGRLSENDQVLKESLFEYARDNGMLDADYAGDRDIKPEPEEDAAAADSEDDSDEDSAADLLRKRLLLKDRIEG